MGVQGQQSSWLNATPPQMQDYCLALLPALAPAVLPCPAQPAPGSEAAQLWDTFAHMHSNSVSEFRLHLASSEGREETSCIQLIGRHSRLWQSSCHPCTWHVLVSVQWCLCGCPSLQGTAWHVPVSATARAAVKGACFGLCLLQTLWCLVEQGGRTAPAESRLC